MDTYTLWSGGWDQNVCRLFVCISAVLCFVCITEPRVWLRWLNQYMYVQVHCVPLYLPPSLGKLGDGSLKVVVSRSLEVEDGVAYAVVDAKRRLDIVGLVDGVVAVRKAKRHVVLEVDLGEANLLVAPPRASLALGRHLEVRLVDMRARLEDLVRRRLVDRGRVVATDNG